MCRRLPRLGSWSLRKCRLRQMCRKRRKIDLRRGVHSPRQRSSLQQQRSTRFLRGRNFLSSVFLSFKKLSVFALDQSISDKFLTFPQDVLSRKGSYHASRSDRHGSSYSWHQEKKHA
jgi:hypothetical protein